MARGFAWVLNFDADDELAGSTSVSSSYTPGRSVLARFPALTAEIAPTLLGPGDHVLVPAWPEARGRPAVEARGMEGRAFCPTPRARTALAAAGAIVPDDVRIGIRVREAVKRPVSAVADQREVRDVKQVEVAVDRTRALTLLFDPEHALDERIAREQFIG